MIVKIGISFILYVLDVFYKMIDNHFGDNLGLTKFLPSKNISRFLLKNVHPAGK